MLLVSYCLTSFSQESIAINKSLFVLRNVIKALATASGATLDDDIIEGEDEGGEEGKKAGPAVAHFRDSKLTSLLKHSLGGNSLTLMVHQSSLASCRVRIQFS